MTDSPGGPGRPRERHGPPAGRVALRRAGPPSRVRPPGTVPGAQEIFTTEIPYRTYFWGPGNIPWGLESRAQVLDLVGNAWEFTNEFQDEHTRAVLTRGGSHYYPVVSPASHWYYPNNADMRKLTGPHGKYMLMSDSYDRAGTVGFRCVADSKKVVADSKDWPQPTR
jgi:hypothetical protein